MMRTPNLHAFTTNPRTLHHSAQPHISIVSSSSFHRDSRFGPSLTSLRGGASSLLMDNVATSTTTPLKFFNSALLGLFVATATVKLLSKSKTLADSNSPNGNDESSQSMTKNSDVRSIQRKFLSVFWLLRCADWLQGPYFYEVYASKMFNGAPASLSLVSRLFLTGFISTAAFGPLVGRLADTRGRKKGTLAFTALYAVGALSTKSPLLWVLLLGRVASGIGTSLLFSAPESWLVGESARLGVESSLGETFGLAYAGDALVAILAGQMAALAAGLSGPTGPFQLSVGFLAAGAVLASFLWKENVAMSDNSDGERSTIRDAVKVVTADQKIMLVGAVQALFEAAMYIFVLQWPPAVTAAISQSSLFGTEGIVTPYGTVFSCFMASCLLGSSIFSHLTNKKKISTEKSATGMLALATLSMGMAAVSTSSLSTFSAMAKFASIVASFFAFEACVGMYFPSIGTLRGKYIPDSHRSVIMNLFGIPLNVLVVSVFLSIKKLGVSGALACSTSALGLALASILKLRSVVAKEEKTTS